MAEVYNRESAIVATFATSWVGDVMSKWRHELAGGRGEGVTGRMVASHVINLFIKKALKFSLAVFISTVLLFLAVGLSARLTQNYLLIIAN